MAPISKYLDALGGMASWTSLQLMTNQPPGCLYYPSSAASARCVSVPHASLCAFEKNSVWLLFMPQYRVRYGHVCTQPVFACSACIINGMCT